MWYTRQYESDYVELHNAVKNYITSMQGTLAPRTELLKKNAYRAVMPVLITLIVTILIVLMLFYFVNCYGVQPITELNKRLDDYLRYKLPFAAKGEFVDELASIKEQIEVLITRNKRRIDE
jgi:predicted PurR-regulated permease PerM